MKDLKQKTKDWYGENKETIDKGVEDFIDFCIGTAMLFGVAIIATKVNDYRIGAGIREAHHNGIIKFFNPSTGSEVGIKEAEKLLSELADKVHK